MEQDGLFDDDNTSDIIALLYIYLPLLRTKLHQFVENWNTHKIRKQSKRPNLPTGEPYYNFYFPPSHITNYQTPVSESKIQQLQEQHLCHSSTGELYGSYTSIKFH